MPFKVGRVLGYFLVVSETVLVTFLEYQVADTYYSIDALYCIPLIQAAHLGAIRSKRGTDSQVTTITAIAIAFAWSLVEAAIIWPTFPLNAFVFNVFIRSVTFTVIGRIVTRLWKAKEYANKDQLTNLGNRHELFSRMEDEVIRSLRTGRPYSLLFIDIDRFKNLNDDYGHHVGDDALVKLANILRDCTRQVDTVTRFGGDEFVILLPDTEAHSCDLLVKRIKSTAESEFNKKNWSISLSIGKVTETGNNKTIDEILLVADKRMYEDKRAKFSETQ